MQILQEELNNADSDEKDRVYSSLRLLERTSSESNPQNDLHQSSDQNVNLQKLLSNILIPQNSEPNYI